MDKWGDNGAYEGRDKDTMAAGFESTCPGWRKPVKWEIGGRQVREMDVEGFGLRAVV